MNVYKCIFITIFVFTLLYFSGCNLQKNVIKNHQNINPTQTPVEKITYFDERFKFYVSYPKNWSNKIEPYLSMSLQHELSPDSGIRIYVDSNENDVIYVYGQTGYVGDVYSDFTKKSFKTSSGLEGILRSKEINGKMDIHLIFTEGHRHGAHILVSSDSYKKNQNEIMDILKSIKISK